MPELENCMYNYMQCNQMMFGRRVRFGISYKTNERSFEIYRRKYMHNLRVQVHDSDFSGSKGIELTTMNTFLVTKINQVLMFDSTTFKQCGEIPIQLLDSDTREPNEVIGLQKTQCENWLAIISGKNLIRNEQKQNQLFIFKRVAATDKLSYDTFTLHKRIILKDIPFFKKVSMDYYFRNEDYSRLIFAKQDQIFEMNIETEEITTIHKFNPALLCQPEIFRSNTNQDIFIAASRQDGIWADVKNGKEVDLDEEYEVGLIQDVVFDKDDCQFYFLCNMRQGKVGFFLIRFQEQTPKNFDFLTMWQHKLDIGDVSMQIIRDIDKTGKPYKELIIGYKTIYINTYNLVV